MFAEMHRLLRLFDQDPLVSLIILEGAGDKAFCAGGDLKEFCTETKGGKQFCWEEYRLDTLLQHLKTPVLALINGILMGGGCGIAINSRYRIASEKTLFAMPEVRFTIQ